MGQQSGILARQWPEQLRTHINIAPRRKRPRSEPPDQLTRLLAVVYTHVAKRPPRDTLQPGRYLINTRRYCIIILVEITMLVHDFGFWILDFGPLSTQSKIQNYDGCSSFS